MGFRSLGKDVFIEKSVKIVNPWNIDIGDNVRIDQFSFLLGGNNGGLKIGSHIHIAGNAFLGGHEEIVIADFVNIAAYCRIYSITDNFDGSVVTGPAFPASMTKHVRKKTVLNEHTLLGAGSTVLPGVTCGVATATGAHSLLHEDTEPFSIYAGIPAKRILSRQKGLIEQGDAFRNEYRKKSMQNRST